jgi:L-glyceraldehyde 3-phosphate reductase
VEHRPLPHSDLAVSPLCLGTMTFGTPVGEREAIAIVHAALDLGVNFIDTANMYEGYTRSLGSPGGLAEAFVGKALRDRRDRAIVATKAGNPIGPAPEDKGLSRAHLLRECERSLVRLQTDYLDLFYLHVPDPHTPIEESIAACAELIADGKTRHWALSNFAAGQTREILDLCAENSWPLPVAHQPPFSLLNRAIEADLLPLCVERQLAVIPYRILESGLLSGKYADPNHPPPDSRAAEKPEWLPQLHDPAIQRALAEVAAQAAAANLSLFAYAIRSTLDIPGITSAILGIKRPEQLAAAVQALA